MYYQAKVSTTTYMPSPVHTAQRSSSHKSSQQLAKSTLHFMLSRELCRGIEHRLGILYFSGFYFYCTAGVELYRQHNEE